jgi:hypothetical protein
MSTPPRLRSGPAAGAFVLATLALAVAPARADDAPSPAAGPPATLHIEVEDDDGGSLKLALAAGWLGALIESADIDCEPDGDRRSRAMMVSLRAQGEGGVYEFEAEDGDRVIARRSRGALKLETRGGDGERATIEMPWEAAECLILGVEPPGDLGRRIARGEARLELDAREDGSRVRISLR